MYLFRGDSPIKGVLGRVQAPAAVGHADDRHQFPARIPYRDAFLMRDAEQFRRELTMPLILLGGSPTGETMDRAMEAGFDFVAMGRALLAEPDLINRIRADGAVQSVCDHCNKCMPTIYSRTHCVVTGGPA